MKKYVCMSLMSILSIGYTSVEARAVRTKKPALCYCSDVCEMRKVREDDTLIKDKKTGILFCKQRDKDNYIKNGCAATSTR